MSTNTPAKKYDIVSLGSIYLDLIATNFPIDAGLEIETETIGGGYHWSVGGSAVNSMATAARLGLKPVFIGKIGTDTAGEIVSTLLNETGIEPALISSDTVQTNVSINYVNPKGETLMSVVGSANQSLSAEEVIDKITEILPQTKILYIGGYFKLSQLHPVLLDIIELAHSYHTQVVIDHGRWSNLAQDTDLDVLKKIITQSDFYLPSEDEFKKLWEINDLQTGLKKLRDQLPAMTVIKQAEHGAIALNAKGAVVHIPAFKIIPKNTIGAGDSFNAGLLYAYLHNYELSEMITFAHATAALKITQQPISLQHIKTMLE